MTRRDWTLFAAMSVIWGMPYLFIKVAVEDVEPAVVVFGRTALAGVVLLAIAAPRGQIRPVFRHWRPVLAFAAIEMIIPWLMLSHAEVHLPSGLTGLLVACVPLAAVLVAYLLGDHHALRPVRLAGIAVGLSGVALLVGGDLNSDSGVPWLSVGQVMVVCVCYAVGPFIVARRLADVPSLGVVALSLCVAAVVVAPLAWLDRPDAVPPADALWSIVGLALICSALAFIVFFALIEAIGPDRATLITFVNPAVAVLLGAVFLDEAITAATVGGFVLVLAGCWLATRPAVNAEPTPADSALRP
ncbi:MAG TPA: EamA family transporter [Acidimicrobiia bacterium]|nr:EamA family transporter [Acidimicrobiia bacterium]